MKEKEEMSVGMKFAMLIICLIFLFLGAVIFLPITPEGNEHAKTIVPYFLGIVTILVGFYWGTSSKRNQKSPDEDADKPTPNCN